MSEATVELEDTKTVVARDVRECRAVFEKCDDGTYSVYAENLPGVTSHGDTFAEAEEGIKQAFRLTMEHYAELGLDPPFEPVQSFGENTEERQHRWLAVDVG